MMESKNFIIKSVRGLEVLDSRGNPTVEALVTLVDGSSGRAISPSGASTGTKEAYELRDHDKNRFLGKGTLNAVSNISKISNAITGLDASNQELVDQTMIDLDGTENKSNLGANAILAVSIAVAKAVANSMKIPLYQYLRKGQAEINNIQEFLPCPMMNIVNGGKHASNGLAIQEYMIAPIKKVSFNERLRAGCEIFAHLKNILSTDGHSTNVGDEGGFAPNLSTTQEVVSYIESAVVKAGYKFGEDIAICLDAASSEFYENGKYYVDGHSFSTSELIAYYESLVKKFPIISIEDPLAEDDYEGFIEITKRLKHIKLVGDDLFCTNPKLISQYSERGMCNAVLVKPNQIGTVTETLNAINIAHNNNYTTILSHRSGESEDVTIAHLCVAVNSGWIKTGSLSRTDRTAKYNELLRIEAGFL